MKQFANILWHIPYLGFLRALGTLILALFLIITVVAAPIGVGLLNLARFYLSPFTSAMISKDKLKQKDSTIDPESQLGKIMEVANKLWKVWGTIVKILYFPIGVFMAFFTLFFIAVEFITIVGIPCAMAEAKALSVWFSPVGKVCVPAAVAGELESRKAKEQVDRLLALNIYQTHN